MECFTFIHLSNKRVLYSITLTFFTQHCLFVLHIIHFYFYDFNKFNALFGEWKMLNTQDINLNIQINIVGFYEFYLYVEQICILCQNAEK